jgi:hypothetical protein
MTDTVLRIAVVSMDGSVSSAGPRCRFLIRVEGDNDSNCSLGLSGITINVPRIRSHERYQATEIQMSSYGCSAPFQHGPGDVILGFRDDGSFGEKTATCLKMECVREQWPPHERIALEAVLLAPYIILDLQVRVWSTRPETGDGFGDPDWMTTEQQKDQQGIPAYSLILRHEPYMEYDGSNYIYDECPICGAGHVFLPPAFVCSACRERDKRQQQKTTSS